jgi:hypothetical protein
MKSIDDACMSYRHDFGLMSEDEKDKLRRDAREWLRSFHLEDHDLRIMGEDYPIIENVLWRYLLGANKIMMRDLGKEAEQKWHDELMAYIKTLPDDED